MTDDLTDIPLSQEEMNDESKEVSEESAMV